MIKCDCRVIPSRGEPGEIEFCALHDAAGDMYKALVAFVKRAMFGVGEDTYVHNQFRAQVIQAGKAINKADGK